MRSNIQTEDRIEKSFRELQGRGEGALVAYLTGGDPNPETFLANCAALVDGGVDVIEVGIPFSDPIADGPVIQASSMRALSQGITPARILILIKELSSQYQVPLVILTYYNPILAMGVKRFMESARKSGVDGIVVPDLPIEESNGFRATALEQGIDCIYLVAPNTSKPRLSKIIGKSKGFLYLVSLYGVTGPRETLSRQALETVKTVKSVAKGKIPIAAGFGISRPEHISAIMRSGADGVIVGSALVRIIQDHLGDPAGAEESLGQTVRALKGATRKKND